MFIFQSFLKTVNNEQIIIHNTNKQIIIKHKITINIVNVKKC